MRIAPAIAAFGVGAFAGSWPVTMAEFRHDWALSPVSGSRRGVWEAGLLSADTARILVRPDFLRGGSLGGMDWWAERAGRERDLPDDIFWSILDVVSAGAEWTESDPDALPPEFLATMEGKPAQGFLCRSCTPPLAAATWVSGGSTRLRIGRTMPPKGPSPQPGLASGVTAKGLRSLASDRGLGLESTTPCHEGKGECALEFSGPKGQRWTFRRASGGSPWSSVDATLQAGPWWSPQWNWDSLRIANRREFANTLSEWLGADADVSARNLLGPVEPVLNFPVSAWFAKTLPGLHFEALGDSLSRLEVPPSDLELVRTPTLQVSIDAFGRRTIRVGR
jgi:hypothetical protein